MKDKGKKELRKILNSRISSIGLSARSQESDAEVERTIQKRRRFRIAFLAYFALGLLFVLAFRTRISLAKSDAEDIPELIAQIGHRGLVWSIDISSDGRWLASGSDDKSVKLWDLNKGYTVFTFVGHIDEVLTVAISPNEKWLASAGRDDTVRIWNIETGKEERVLKGHSKSIESLAFSPNGYWLASGSFDDTIKIWQVGSWKATLMLDHGSSVDSLSFSRDSRVLASGGWSIKLWDVTTGNKIVTFNPHWEEAPLKHLVTAVRFAPDGDWLASAGGDTVKIWDIVSQREVRTLSGHNEEIESLAFGPNGIVTTGDENGTIIIWDLTKNKKIRTRTRADSDYVTSLAITPDGQSVVSNDLVVLQLESGETVRDLQPKSASIKSVEFSLNSRWMAMQTYDEKVHILDLSNGYLTRTLSFDDYPMNMPGKRLSFSPDGRWLAWGDLNSGTVVLIETSTGKKVREFSSSNTYQVSSLAFTPDGRLNVSYRHGHRPITPGAKHVLLVSWDIATGRRIKILMRGHFGPLREQTVLSKNGKWLACQENGYNGYGIEIWDIDRASRVKVLVLRPR